MRAPRPKVARALPLVIPLDDIDRTRAALLHLEVAAQLGQAILDKPTEHGEDEAIEGVRSVFMALAALLTSAATTSCIWVAHAADLVPDVLAF